MSDQTQANFDFDNEVNEDSLVKVAHRPFRSLRRIGDSNQWEIAPIGELRRVRHTRQNAEGKNLTELEFVPYTTEEDEEPTTYSLGHFKGAHVIDHAPLYRPLLDQGWEVQTHTFTRGGARVATVLSYPHRQLEDLIDWDRSIFDNPEERTMHPSILIKADAKRGTSYQATAGFFRVICTNGLIARALDVGSVTFRHGTLSPERVSAEIKELADVTQDLRSIRSSDQREFRPEAARWAAHVLKNYPAREAYPRFIANFMTGITRVLRTNERIHQLGHEFEMLSEQDRPYTVLDTLNAVTNVSQNFRTMYGLEAATSALLEMSEVGEYVFEAVRFTKQEIVKPQTESDDDDDFDE